MHAAITMSSGRASAPHAGRSGARDPEMTNAVIMPGARSRHAYGGKRAGMRLGALGRAHADRESPCIGWGFVVLAWCDRHLFASTRAARAMEAAAQETLTRTTSPPAHAPVSRSRTTKQGGVSRTGGP